MSVYPSGIDSFTTKIDNVDDVLAADVNSLQNSIVAIENTIGVNPTLGINAQLFYTSDNFTVPSGINRIKVRMWAGGGGGGGGSSSVADNTDGTDGAPGENSYITYAGVYDINYGARGGPGGGAGSVTATHQGYPTGALQPTVFSDLIRYGSWNQRINRPGNELIHESPVDNANQPSLFMVVTANQGPTANSSSGGGGGNSDNTGYGGGAGNHGEYAELFVPVNPGDVIPVTVGAGGIGGGAGSSAASPGYDGSTGVVIIEW